METTQNEIKNQKKKMTEKMNRAMGQYQGDLCVCNWRGDE